MIIALDDVFVDSVRSHLSQAHPGRIYTENEIMLMAMPIPDRAVRTHRD